MCYVLVVGIEMLDVDVDLIMFIVVEVENLIVVGIFIGI